MLKKLLIGLGIVLVLALASVTTVLIKPNLLRGLIHAGGERFAGLQIEIDSLSSHRAPLRLEIDGLRISNPNWPEPTLLTLDALSLQLLASPFREGPFWAVESDGLNVRVANNDKGEMNWLTTTLQRPASEQPAVPETASPLTLPGDFSFDHVVLRDTQLQFITASGEQYRLALPEIRGKRLDHGNGELVVELDYQEQHFTLRGDITLFDPQAAILDYRLSLSHADAALESQGRLNLSPTLKDSRIALTLQLEKLDRLAALAGVDAPPLPPSELSTTLRISPDYQFEPLALAVGDNRLSGALRLSPDVSRIDAKLSSPSLDVDALIAALTPPATDSDNGAAAASEAGREEAPIDWQWMAEKQLKLVLDVTKLTASGWWVNELHSELQSDEAIRLSLRAANIAETATARRIADLDTRLTLSPLAEKTEGADAQLDLELRQQALTLSAEGEVNLNGVPGTRLKLSSRAPRSAEIWALALLPWQEAGALALDATVETDAKQYRLAGEASLGEQATALTLNYQPGSDERRAELSGEISLRNTSLAFMQDPNAATDKADKPPADKRNGKLISSEPLALDALQQINAELAISLEQVDTGYLLINRAELNPRLRGGVLELDDSRLYVDSGEAYVRARLDASGEQATVSTELKIDSSDYGALGLEKAAGISDGKGKIRIKLDGRGNNPAALAGSLDGQLDIKITDLTAKGNALNLIGSDVLTETIDKLNPFSEKRQNTEIECLAVHFKGKNGRFTSEDGIALETDGSKIIGTGHVDLGKEELRLGISPIARKGVGINVGAAASLVRLGGTFSRPRVEADPSGMFSGGLSTGAAIYTGGLSLLAQGLVKRALYAGSACDGELDEIPSAEEIPDELLNPPPAEGAAPADGVAPNPAATPQA